MADRPVLDREPVLMDDTDDQDPTAAAMVPLPYTDRDSPTTLDSLAALRGEAMAVLEARITILETARKRAIKMTVPEDWVLFQRNGRITAYLQDCGCERVRDVLGINIFNVRPPVKEMADDGESFMYLQSADGMSTITKQVVRAVEGGRSSQEDFCKGDTGPALVLKVRKACRANVNGNIARTLMGLRNVPITELQDAWQGTGKTPDHCHQGRGFGSAAERLGATRAGVPDVPPPICPVCKVPLLYREGKNDRPAFYGCKSYQSHPNQKVIVNAADWVATQQKAAATNGADAKRQDEENKRLDAEIAARERQPGEDG
jgi:hypothetical protein